MTRHDNVQGYTNKENKNVKEINEKGGKHCEELEQACL